MKRGAGAVTATTSKASGPTASSGGGPSASAEDTALFDALWSGGLNNRNAVVSNNAADQAHSKDQRKSSPAKARNRYGAWYMPTNDWRAVYGGSAEDEESIQARMGSISIEEIERRNSLDQQRASLRNELGKTYTVRVYREYIKDKCVREPLGITNIADASDREIRERNAQAALHGSRAVGGAAEDSLLQASSQAVSDHSSRADPYFGLASGMRVLVDGIRPSDLDIDEIIAPELREMVRRTVAMNDRLQEHARIVSELHQERSAKASEWAVILRARKAALAAAAAGGARASQRRPSVPAFQTPHGRSSAAAAESGTASVPASPSRATNNRASVVCSPADSPQVPLLCRRTLETPAQGRLQLGTEAVHVEGRTSEAIGMQLGRVSPTPADNHRQGQTSTLPPGTPTRSTHSHSFSHAPRPPSRAATQDSTSYTAEEAGAKLEGLAERIDVPFGVRFLAALGAATAGASPSVSPVSPLARKPGSTSAWAFATAPVADDAGLPDTSHVEQQQPGLAGEYDMVGTRRWLHANVPNLHSAMQTSCAQHSASAPSNVQHQAFDSMTEAAHRPPSSPGSVEIIQTSRCVLPSPNPQARAHPVCAAIETTLGELSDGDADDGWEMANAVRQPKASSTTLDSRHHQRHHQHSQHDTQQAAEEWTGQNLSLSWLSGERVRRPTDRIASSASSSFRSESSPRFAKHSIVHASLGHSGSQGFGPGRFNSFPTLQLGRSQSRVQTAPHSLIGDRVRSSLDHYLRPVTTHPQAERQASGRRAQLQPASPLSSPHHL